MAPNSIPVKLHEMELRRARNTATAGRVASCGGSWAGKSSGRRSGRARCSGKPRPGKKVLGLLPVNRRIDPGSELRFADGSEF
jgi:hypothetical protein